MINNLSLYESGESHGNRLGFETMKLVLCNGEKHHVAFKWLEQPESAGQPRVKQSGHRLA